MLRIISVFVFTVILLGLPNSSYAKSLRIFNSSNDQALLDKLVEKGALSATDATEIVEENEKAAKKHSINISTRLQALYTYSDYEPSSAKSDKDEFTLRRIRLNFTGYMYEDIDYKLELAADRLASFSLKDSWFGVKHVKHMRVRIGQFKTPFSRQRMTSSSKLQIINRSPIEVLYPGRDVGIELSGKNIGGMFDYGFAILGGVGDKFKFKDTSNRSAVFLGRAAVHPFGGIKYSEGDHANTQDFKFEFVANALAAPKQIAFGEKGPDKIFNAVNAFGVADLASMPRGNIFVVGPELAIVYKGLSLLSEGYFARYNSLTDDVAKITTSRRGISTMGYFVQGGYFIVESTVELAARFDQLDVDRASQKDPTDFKSITGGINYYIVKNHNFKFQVNYTRKIYASSLNLDHSKFEGNVQVAF